MKKIILSILIVTFTVVAANGQFLKGSKHFGINLKYQFNPNKNRPYSNFCFQYFIKDNFAIGLTLDHIVYGPGGPSGQKFSYDALVGVRKYFGTQKFKTFLSAEIGLGQSWNISSIDYYANSTILPFNVSYLRTEVEGGVQYALANWLALEATAGLGLSQVVSSSNMASSSKLTMLVPNIGLGLKFTLPPKVKKDKKQLTE